MKHRVLLFETGYIYIIKQHHFYFLFFMQHISCSGPRQRAVKSVIWTRKHIESQTLMTKLVRHVRSENVHADSPRADESTFASPHFTSRTVFLSTFLVTPLCGSLLSPQQTSIYARFLL